MNQVSTYCIGWRNALLFTCLPFPSIYKQIQVKTYFLYKPSILTLCSTWDVDLLLILKTQCQIKQWLKVSISNLFQFNKIPHWVSRQNSGHIKLYIWISHDTWLSVKETNCYEHRGRNMFSEIKSWFSKFKMYEFYLDMNWNFLCQMNKSKNISSRRNKEKKKEVYHIVQVILQTGMIRVLNWQLRVIYWINDEWRVA